MPLFTPSFDRRTGQVRPTIPDLFRPKLTRLLFSGNRIEAVNRFVRNNFDFSSDHTSESPYSFIRLSFDLAPSLLSLSIGSCSCIRLDQWNPPMLTHLNLSHLNSHNFPPEILAVRNFPISVLGQLSFLSASTAIR